MTLSRKTIGWLGPVLLCSTITAVSGQSVDVEEVVPNQDKLIHILVFGLIATAWLRWLLLFKSEISAAMWAIVLTGIFGAFDEFRQSFVPGRFAGIDDWLADIFGAVLATLCYLKWKLYRSILEWPKWFDPKA